MTITLEQVINAMNLLGGHCYLKDLYAKLTELYPDDVIYKGDGFTRTVENIIHTQSNDSGKKPKAKDFKDLFYSVEGIGKAHWGLRNPDITEKTMDFSNDDEGFAEGKEILRKHLLKERNHSLKRKAIIKFKENHENRVFCEICGFDFQEKYGDIGKDFVEAHHIKPVSEMKENEQTKIEDIVLLCSNCHSMIHRKRPWLSKEKIKKLLKE